jgi:hypothetical protein
MGSPALEDLLLAFNEATGIRALMLGSSWAWPTAEILHYTGLTLLIGTIGLFDLRVLGWAKALPLQSLHRLVPFGVAGFCLNLVTGVMFITSFPDQYLYNPAVQTKFALMFVAAINMLLFYRIAWHDLRALGPEVAAPLRARVFTLVSLLAWLGVIACGRLITFFRPPNYWCFWCGT